MAVKKRHPVIIESNNARLELYDDAPPMLQLVIAIRHPSPSVKEQHEMAASMDRQRVRELYEMLGRWLGTGHLEERGEEK